MICYLNGSIVGQSGAVVVQLFALHFSSGDEKSRNQDPKVRSKKFSGASWNLHDDDKSGGSNVTDVTTETFVDKCRLRNVDKK